MSRHAGHERPGQPRRERRDGVPDRYVVLVAAAVVLIVLGMLALSIWLPAFGQLLAFAPVLIVVLLAVTVLVLVRALTTRRPPAS